MVKVGNDRYAELKRMVKVGNDRYAEHLKKDSELKSLMAKNKEANEKAMDDMSQKFYAQLADIKAQMKKDRAHAEHSLSTNTGALFKTLADNQQAQDAVNKELTEATRRAKLDAEAALKEAKEGFTSKVAKLHEVVKTNEKKHNAKVEELTGVVAANAIKDAEGRAELKKISAFNKNQMKKAVADAVHAGEQRALQIEKKMKDINAKTRASMNNRITSEISTLSKSIHSQIDELNLQTKEARAKMKEQVAADKANIIAHVNDAVAAQNAALLALKQETNHEIKKTNKALDAQAEIMIENAESVREEMKANTAAIVASLEAARKAADEQLASVNAASEARYNEVVKAVEDGVDSAMKAADEKFSQAYITMATNRKHFGEELASGYDKLNDSIAKLAALEDERFSKTVKDISAARKEASDQVAAARKHMKSAIVATTATAKQTEP